MVINPKFIFVHLEKTGGTSLFRYLINLKDSIGVGRIKNIKNSKMDIYGLGTCRHDSLFKVSQYFEDKFKFGYIRNPFDWYVSFWKFFQIYPHSITYQSLYKNIISKKNVNFFVNSLYRSKHQISYYNNGVIDKKNIITHIDFKKMSELDIGLLTYRYLYIYYHPDVFNDIENYKDYLLADDILRFEKLKSELYRVFNYKIFKLNKHQIRNLYKMGKSRVSNHKHYSKYYHNSTIELIKHKDRIIFKEFGYEF